MVELLPELMLLLLGLNSMALALVPVKKSVKIKLPLLSSLLPYYADDAEEQDEIKRDLNM